VDAQGRVYLPKSVRERIGAKPGTVFKLRVQNSILILEERKSIVRESKGIYKTKEPIEGIDRIIEDAAYEDALKEL
jgi:AbrB family looped-hinge helix DNA binding protein